MSGRSARNYWTDAQLSQDAAYWRSREDFHRRQAHTETNPSYTLRMANTAKVRAEASETILRCRHLDAEQTARSGADQ